MKTISKEGLSFIKSFEGCRLTSYDDLQPSKVITSYASIKGTLTIGYGHTGNDVFIGQVITPEQADRLLFDDLTKFIKYVNNPGFVPLTMELNQNQFDALVSFCYNCGPINLKSLCSNRNIKEIAEAIPKYNKSNGKELAGLVRRRKAEQELFNKSYISDIVEVKPVELSQDQRIEKLESIVKDILIDLTRVKDLLSEHPAPNWFVKEFPDALKLIDKHTGTDDFWRAFAVSLRILKNISK